MGISLLTMVSIVLRMYMDEYRDLLPYPLLLVLIFMFTTASTIFLLNLLIVMLNSCYVFINRNMVGFARLKRASVITDTLMSIPEPVWKKFYDTLGMDLKLEFNEGDIGISGGLQAQELATEHPVTIDTVRRYGGSCDAGVQWPEDLADQEEEDRLYRVERLVRKTLKRLSSNARGTGSCGGSRGSGSSGGSGASMISSSQGGD